MECPTCQSDQSTVVDSRALKDGKSIRRRRNCLKCGERWTTTEVREGCGKPLRRAGTLHQKLLALKVEIERALEELDVVMAEEDEVGESYQSVTAKKKMGGRVSR